MSVALVKMAGLTPVSAICEMMGDDGNALRKDKAMEYAKKNGLVYLSGNEIIEGWKKWLE